MDLVIMAAGMGSRFGGLKQIEPVDKNGNFIIDYSIFDAIKCGFKRVVFIIKEENYDIFRQTVGKRVEKQIETVYVFQKNDNLPANADIPATRVKPLGTGHAILCCKDVVKDNFAIINADDFYGYDAYRVIGDFLKNNTNPDEYALVGYMVENTMTENGKVKRGVCEEKEGYLTKIVESSIGKEADGRIVASPLSGAPEFEVRPNDTVSMNMLGFTPKLFEYLENKFVKFFDDNKDNKETCEFLIPEVVSDLIQENRVQVRVLPTTAVWQGITYKEDKEKLVNELASLVNKGEYPENLWD
ncbi:MAG: nucleotidyltransferase [Clostridiales bacterium]|nr:nucleotidyltransferase [Clostridiales bacterium]